MFTNFSKYFEDECCVEKYVRFYELALFLKCSPADYVEKLYYFDSVLEYVLQCNNLINDYYDEYEDCWYPGFFMPRTADLVEGLMRMYYKGGAKKLLIKVPVSLLPILEEVKTRPKYRWRNIGKEKRKVIPFFKISYIR